MSHDSYVFGMIKSNKVQNHSEDQRIIDGNLEAIERLPKSKEEDSFPFLTSSMFSYTASPQYRDNIIHFGAAYKDILGSWVDFEKKFSNLLLGMSWYEVTIIIEDCYIGSLHVSYKKQVTDNKQEGGVWTREYKILNLKTSDTVDLSRIYL